MFEGLHEVLLTEMEVHGAGMHRGVGALPLDEAEDRAGPLVHDGEGLAVSERSPTRPAG